MNKEHPDIALDIKDLKVHFPIYRGVFSNVAGYVKAVDGVSFTVERGEVFALVGESGCGKTTTAHAVLGLTRPTQGELSLAIGPWKKSAVHWMDLSTNDRKTMRRHLQVVFQDPYSSLNPRMTVRAILEEPLSVHNLHTGNRIEKIDELLGQVGLSHTYLYRYPHEFSGGQRQRIGIARALATGPEFIVADEPVSALDVSIQAQIINLLQDLQQKYNLTMLFISHDLAVVRHLANRLAVMYLGHILEMGTESQIFSTPFHPYTHLLLESVPVPGKGRSKRASAVPDEKPSSPPEHGCPFYPRCIRKLPLCQDQFPELKDVGSGHLTACFNPGE